MSSERLHRIIKVQIKKLQKYAGRSWYVPLIGLLSALDNIVVIIPNDGILVSSSMLKPKRWHVFATSMAIGNTLGAIFLAALVEMHGLPWILNYFPGLDQTQMWSWSMQFLTQYGLLFVFIIGITPLMQQPAIILASLANTPLLPLTAVIFVSRILKFFVMAYVGSHSPKFLNKIWGIKKELEDADVKIP